MRIRLGPIEIKETNILVYVVGALKHYPTMNIDALKRLPVKSLTDDNCMMFMWATFPNLQEELDLIKEWGFKYKTLGFSWIKTNIKNGKPFLE